MKIKYNASVMTQAGWRGVTITAEVKQISKGMAEVVKVTEINGEAPSSGMSRTGAKRQSYNGKHIALREVGAKKRLSACTIVEAAAA